MGVGLFFEDELPRGFIFFAAVDAGEIEPEWVGGGPSQEVLAMNIRPVETSRKVY